MEQILIFTDGASRGNPGRGGWGAIVVEATTVHELGGREAHTTNNRMEMTAALEALSILKSGSSATLHTDSNYLINGITKWVFGWKKNGWKTKEKKEVENRDLWKKLIDAIDGKKIEWKYVGGHVGIAGNERCDEIATSFADDTPTILYRGSRMEYSLDITNTTANTDLVKNKRSSGSGSGTKAYSYLSLVDGRVERHTSWTECERRVKGKPARFKKALSPEHEQEILREWEVSSS